MYTPQSTKLSTRLDPPTSAKNSDIVYHVVHRNGNREMLTRSTARGECEK